MPPASIPWRSTIPFTTSPRARTFDAWRDAAPTGYALKFGRYGSHVKCLQNPTGIVKKFLGRAERLRKSLGPILVQLPPNWSPRPDRLTTFLEAAPRRHRWAVESAIAAGSVMRSSDLRRYSRESDDIGVDPGTGIRTACRPLRSTRSIRLTQVIIPTPYTRTEIW